MKKFSILFLMPIVVLALSGACKGDDGEDGLDGTNGTNGTNGANGANGAPGTANVIYSDWEELAGASWRDSTIMGAAMNVNHLIVPLLTQEIIDGGVVLCYFKYATNIAPLPFTNKASGKTEAYTLNYMLSLGKIIFTLFTHDNTASVSLVNTIKYRYIIIPGGASATKSTVDYTKMNYEDVCYELDIPE